MGLTIIREGNTFLRTDVLCSKFQLIIVPLNYMDQPRKVRFEINAVTFYGRLEIQKSE